MLSKNPILITGGSGSLGRHLIKCLLKEKPTHIYSLSRDENLIKEAQIFVSSPKLTFLTGDIRDENTVKKILPKIKIIFHLASQKDVPLAQLYPQEALKTNILGLLNILENANNVKLFINVSTDKVIGVVNYYGATKLLAEGLVIEANNYHQGKFINIRLPNLFASRGSVVDLWQKTIKKQNTILITHPKMTRYFITLPDAADFIIKVAKLKKLSPQKIYFPKKNIKKFRLSHLASAFVKVFGDKKTKIEKIGPRPGEKLHEDYIKGIPLQTAKQLENLLKTLTT